jgi:methyltransferase (TIGR00027 family)
MIEKNEANLPLALTARWTASARASESSRDDCLFKDPWATALGGEEGAEWLAERGGSGNLMVIRTRYFDDFLQTAAYQHGLQQIVMLAAGLDTRAYRLQWPEGTHLFELDQKVVLQYKAQVLRNAGALPTCKRTEIAVDLTGHWQEELLTAGFDPEQPSAWLLEGILFYLPNDAITGMLADVSAMATAGSRMGFDVINSLTLTSPITKGWIEMQSKSGAPWLGALDDPESFLAGIGWNVEMTQPGSPDAHFGRWSLPVIPIKMPNMPHQWYVTAEKRK